MKVLEATYQAKAVAAKIQNLSPFIVIGLKEKSGLWELQITTPTSTKIASLKIKTEDLREADIEWMALKCCAAAKKSLSF